LAFETFRPLLAWRSWGSGFSRSTGANAQFRRFRSRSLSDGLHRFSWFSRLTRHAILAVLAWRSWRTGRTLSVNAALKHQAFNNKRTHHNLGYKYIFRSWSLKALVGQQQKPARRRGAAEDWLPTGGSPVIRQPASAPRSWEDQTRASPARAAGWAAPDRCSLLPAALAQRWPWTPIRLQMAPLWVPEWQPVPPQVSQVEPQT